MRTFGLLYIMYVICTLSTYSILDYRHISYVLVTLVLRLTCVN